MVTPQELAAFIRTEAHRLGFQAVGFAGADDLPATERVLLQRIDAGLLRGLPWFNARWAELCAHPRLLLPEARTLVALGASYRTPDPPAADPEAGPRGRVARYAWGADYHPLLRKRAKLLAANVAAALGRPAAARAFVDIAPMPEREVARQAGMGWMGKNTNVMVKGLGSWVFLAVLALDVEVPAGEPLATHCGDCDLCLRACPTGAIVAPYTVDNDRCISYQTIENRGYVPLELRPLLGDWVYGCDVCQDVCPVNRKAAPAAEPAFHPPHDWRTRPPLLDLLAMDVETYQQRFKDSPMKRPKRSGLQRNAAIALGNAGDATAVPTLAAALASDPDPHVRGHAAWALGRIGGAEAAAALRAAAGQSGDAGVEAEVSLALAQVETAERTPG